MVGVAVKVTLVPEQIVDEVAETATEGTTAELTVIVTSFDKAATGVAHDSLEVILQLITSPLLSAPLV